MKGDEQRDIIAPTVSIEEAARRPWDAVVIGAGPAGAVAARALALSGRGILLVDRSRFPRAKVCGCCLSGAAIDILDRAGLAHLLDRLGAAPLLTLRVHAGGAEAELPSRGAAVSRAALDAALIREAIRAGAAFLPETVGRWRPSGPTVRPAISGQPADPLQDLRHIALNAAHTLVSDGLAGSALGEDPPAVAPRAKIGLSALLDEPFEPRLVRMACGPSGYVGAVAIEDGRLNIAAAIDPVAVRRSGGPAGAVAAILSSCGLQAPDSLAQARWRGAPTLTRSRRCLYRPGLLVLGDAAAYVEPFTGEGIGWALASGLAAANLVIQGQSHRWPRTHGQLIARRQRACRAVAALLRRPIITSAAVRVLARIPWLASPTLELVHRPLPELAP